ncbi:pectinesterase inhibitor 7-like [Wolffia australiana]
MAYSLLAKAIIVMAVLQCAVGRTLIEDGDAEFVKTRCEATTYPGLCYETLSAHASAIQRNPVSMATMALTISLDGARSAAAAVAGMAARQRMTPREAAAVRDCVETVSNAVDELRRSIVEMGHLRRRDRDLAFHISNIQTWVSAALTDERTCVEGFADEALNGPLKDSMRAHVVSIAQRTSNALALINSLVKG